MKNFAYAIVTGILVTVSSLCARERLDCIVAVVGDSIILSSELEAFTFMQINQLGVQPDSFEMDLLRHKFLNDIVDGKVLLAHAERDTNITVSNEEIEGEVNTRITFILRENRISMQEFEQLLEKEQNITLSKFKKEIRQQIRQEILKQRVQQLYIPADKITRSDIEKFYQQYRDSLPQLGESILLSKIVINLTPSDEVRQKAFSKITSIKAMLDKGEDFVKVAQLHSEDPNASSGGDLGYISKGTLSELTFEEKVFSLKPGEISEPFETRLGFHILNAIDRKDQKMHVRQIFVNIAPPEKEIQKIMALFDSLKSACKTRECFTGAVKKYSTDEASKARDGQINWQTAATLDGQIRGSFDSLYIGNLSTPLRSSNSIALYRIDEIKKNRPMTLAEDWNQISQIAVQFYTQRKLVELVAEWKKEIFIDIRL